jgi:hypothetical protein
MSFVPRASASNSFCALERRRSSLDPSARAPRTRTTRARGFTEIHVDIVICMDFRGAARRGAGAVTSSVPSRVGVITTATR